MKKLLLMSVLFFGVLAAKAQDDLLGDLEKDDAGKVKQNITTATFKSTRIINMQSVEMTGKGNLQFMITHHFAQIWPEGSTLSKNAAQLFGLNSGFANTYMSFDYSPTTYLNLGLASTGNSQFEGWAKFRIARQQTGKKNIPVTFDYLACYRADATDGPSPMDNAWNRFSFMHQLLVARKFDENFSLQFTGTVVHDNMSLYGLENKNNTYSVGFGGRYKLTHKTAITFEANHLLNNYEDQMDESGALFQRKPLLIAIGYDWDTGGHIFQFFLSNTTNASNVYQFSKNNLKATDLALGFNLNRSFGIKKVVKTTH